MAEASRPYRGLDAPERARDRRRRLLDAALDLFGTRGYAGVRLQEICAEAAVTARHLYEAFDGREGLLLAVYDEVVATHLERVRAATAAAPPEERLRTGLTAALEAWAEDPRRARVAFVEVVGASDEVEARRLATIERYAQYVAAELAAVGGAERDHTWQARAMVGALIQVFQSWLALEDRPPLQVLADELLALLEPAVAGTGP